MQKLILTIDDKIRDEKLQHDINREAAKISTLSSGKCDKYEYITVKKYNFIIKFVYSALGKTLEKNTEKQVRALRSLKKDE